MAIIPGTPPAANPGGLCQDPRCDCDDPVCACHREQEHEGQPDSVGLDYRAWPGGRSTPMEPEPDYGTVTMADGYEEDLRAWPGARRAPTGW